MASYRPEIFFQKSANETRFFRQFLKREQKTFLWLLFRGLCQLEKQEISRLEILARAPNQFYSQIYNVKKRFSF